MYMYIYIYTHVYIYIYICILYTTTSCKRFPRLQKCASIETESLCTPPPSGRWWWWCIESLFLYIYICMCVHIYIYIYIYIYVYLPLSLYTYVYIHVYIYIYMRTDREAPHGEAGGVPTSAGGDRRWGGSSIFGPPSKIGRKPRWRDVRTAVCMQSKVK